MAVRSVKKVAGDKPKTPPPAPLAVDSASLSPAELAEAILARTVRPKVADVRRLAEAVLAGKTKKKKKKASEKKAGGKKRKLSKIPGQKAAK